MEDNKQQPQRVFKLSLEKYGLSYLDGKNILNLSDADLDAFLDALGKDDISMNIPIPFTPQNVKELLSYGACRNCGGCCMPNPANPGGPGVEIFDDELKIIARYLQTSYESLKENTYEGQNQDNPWPLAEVIATRLLPLPCMFYNEETKKCRVYDARPLVCTIYPVILGEAEESLDIKVDCDYGKEVARGAVKSLKQKFPDLILRI
ncbi:YkgJ family cysteine cluster protein [Chloroflexota bacterium]